MPQIVLRRWSAWIYIGLNALAGVFALTAIDLFGSPFEEKLDTRVRRIVEILVAAFGALAIMRTAVIQVRVDNRDVQIGPHWVLSALLAFTSKQMSIARARHVQQVTSKIMENVDFEKAKQQLPSYCFLLMKTGDEEQKAVSREITSIDIQSMQNKTKSLQLGLIMLELVGEEVLTQAVEVLKNEIT